LFTEPLKSEDGTSCRAELRAGRERSQRKICGL
jgi:hypothetical protein